MLIFKVFEEVVGKEKELKIDMQALYGQPSTSTLCKYKYKIYRC